MKTPNAITSFLSSLHRHFGPRAQQLDLTDKFAIPLKNGWTATVLLQFGDTAAVCANHQLLVHTSTDIAWEDFSATVKEPLIPPNAVTRLKRDWESLQIKSGYCVVTFNEHFQVLQLQLEPHSPLSDECLRD